MSDYALYIQLINDLTDELIEEVKTERLARVPREGEQFEYADKSEEQDESTVYRVSQVDNSMKKFNSASATGRSFRHEVHVRLRPLEE